MYIENKSRSYELRLALPRARSQKAHKKTSAYDSGRGRAVEPRQELPAGSRVGV